MTVCVLSYEYEKIKQMIDLLIKYGVQNIQIITYNEELDDTSEFLIKNKQFLQLVKTDQQTYENLLQNEITNQNTNLSSASLSSCLTITINYKFTPDDSYNSTYGLIQLNFNENTLNIFNPMLHNEVEAFKAVEAITFDGDHCHVHLYESIKLDDCEITLINFNEQIDQEGQQITSLNSQNAPHLDRKTCSQMTQLGRSLTQDAAIIHQFELKHCEQLKALYQSGGHLRFRRKRMETFTSTISYISTTHIYIFIALKVILMCEAFQRRNYRRECYKLCLVSQSGQTRLNLDDLSEEQRYTSGKEAIIDLLLWDSTLSAGKVVLLTSMQTAELLNTRDVHNVNKMLLNTECDHSDIPYVNETFTVVKTFFQPGKALLFNKINQDESPYEILSKNFQSCDVAYHPREQDACFLKAFAVVQCLRLGIASDFVPDLDGSFLQSLRDLELQIEEKVFILFAYFTNFFFTTDKSQESYNKVIQISELQIIVQKCLNEQTSFQSERCNESALQIMFSQLRRAYKEKEGLSMNDTLEIMKKHLKSDQAEIKKDEIIKNDNKIQWDSLIYELTICRCINFNIPYSQNRIKALTLKYSNQYINIALLDLYKHLQLLPPTISVSINGVYEEDEKKVPENIESRFFEEFNPQFDFLDIYYQENDLIESKENEKLKWDVAEGEVETVGDLINLIDEKINIHVTFLTTLNGMLIYTDVLPEQKLDVQLKSLTDNKYNLVLLSDNEEGEEFPMIRIWM